MNENFTNKEKHLKRKSEILEKELKQLKMQESKNEQDSQFELNGKSVSKRKKSKTDIAASCIRTGVITVFVLMFAVLIWQGVELIIDVTKSAATAIHYSKVEDSVTSGVVIDKKSYTKNEGGGISYGAIYSPDGGVKPGYTFGGSSSSRLVYELTVSYEITYSDGKEYVGEKTFEVSEGAYLSHNIGDTFDSLNYKNDYLEESD